jgi:preprotein translocase SecE subunit
MATAVKTSNETTSPMTGSSARLVTASLVGSLYLFVGLAIVFFGLPTAWKSVLSDVVRNNLGAFFDPLGMGLVILAGIVVLLYLGQRLTDRLGSPPGFRAGVFAWVFGGLLGFLICIWVGRILESSIIRDPANRLGLILMGITAAGLSWLVVRWARSGKLEHYFIVLEQQGWFTTRTYKPNQGRLVRRLTMLGILVIIATGVNSLLESKSFVGNWTIRIPFTLHLLKEDHRLAVTLLPDIRYTAPLLLVALGLWFAWRVVNYPTFADFLIATEAELNKVSWVTRKRLVQDTVVVLVFLALFTVFLLAVDSLWGWVLSRKTLGGIVPTAEKVEKKNPREINW